MDYLYQGPSVIYYQHKARRKDPFYADQLAALLKGPGFPDARGISLKFKTTSQRYYMIIAQPRHIEAIEGAVNGMLSSAWAEHFRLI